MSADDWVECPICRKKREKLLDELFKKLTRKEYELLLKIVEKNNLNADGINYVIENGYLKEDNELINIPKYELKLPTLRIDYEYGIDEEQCNFSIRFECVVCGFSEYLEHTKYFGDKEKIDGEKGD